MGKSLSVSIAVCNFANSEQEATLTKFSGYNEEDIRPIFDLMIDYLTAPVAHEALFKKYASKKFLKGNLTLCDSLFILANLLSASIMARKWAKDYKNSVNGDGGVAIGDIDTKQ